MVNLSDRLTMMAEEVKEGETVADIGTDHGLLPVYLWERGISPHVIMADISRGSLKKAKDNCKSRYPEVEFDFRLGSGIEVLAPGETDCVTIAGMGGMLMTEILGFDRAKSHSFKKFILQPRNNTGLLRHWLLNNGFVISREQLVREGRYICEIITARPGEQAVSLSLGADRIEYQFPHSLIDFKGPLTEEYLRRNIAAEKRILEAVMKGRRPEPSEIRSRRYRIDYLERLLKKL